MTAFAPTLEAFFVERLINQKDASPRTIAAYRDTLRLLLRYASEQTAKQPSKLDFADLDASLISGFLDHLEHERGNSARTRNARLAAIHSLYRFAALRHPEHARTIARVIEIPTKRHTRPLLCYLNLDEIKALLAAPDRASWLGRRDHTLFRIGFGVCPLTVGDYGRCVDLPSIGLPDRGKATFRGSERLAVNGCERRWTVSPKPDGEPG
jgi:integrase/recombinase XerD